MSTDTTTLWPTTTHGQWQAVPILRRPYHHHRDLFTSREFAHLRVLRWLYQAGRPAP